ncbi:uncharacterized protein [Musca autumnalis]|uniref:uncharacterized protein n=1 Tax=Musca autumnalis TaxID=221902 RepID=UPI003CF89E78
MNLTFIILISFTLFMTLPCQPIETGLEAEDEELYASQYEELLQIANKLDLFIEEILPQLPQKEDDDDESYLRKGFQDFLQKKQNYEAASTGEECVENTKKFIDALVGIMGYFVMDLPRTPENIVKIFNDNGMEKLQADLRTWFANPKFGQLKKSVFDKYTIRNC